MEYLELVQNLNWTSDFKELLLAGDPIYEKMAIAQHPEYMDLRRKWIANPHNRVFVWQLKYNKGMCEII